MYLFLPLQRLTSDTQRLPSDTQRLQDLEKNELLVFHQYKQTQTTAFHLKLLNTIRR